MPDYKRIALKIINAKPADGSMLDEVVRILESEFANEFAKQSREIRGDMLRYVINQYRCVHGLIEIQLDRAGYQYELSQLEKVGKEGGENG